MNFFNIENNEKMFKKKKETKSKFSVTKNLDHYHQEDLDEIANNRKQKSENKKAIIELKLILENDPEIQEFATIYSKIKDLENDNQRINTKEIEYYVNTKNITSDYYKSCDKTKTKITIDDFFKNTKRDTESNRHELLNQYLQVTRPSERKTIKQTCSMCKDCNVDLIIMCDKLQCCPKCGREYNDVFVNETIKNLNGTYSYTGDVQKYSIYQRKHHFRDWLKQIQGKESVEIPDDVINTVKKELEKMRFSSLETLDNTTVRDVLKKHNLVKFYENIYQIIFRINGIRPPSLSVEQEERLISLFKEVEEPFHLFKAEERKNILRYSYIIYKLCQLLEYDDLLSRFRLLKNRGKLILQDQVWSKICDYNKWEFFPSI
jgi:hypothetical protein